jgi:tetratricopeptide (TPR) repeat protein
VERGEEDWMRSRIFPAVEDLLRALNSFRPLALLLEDLHWGDSATLDLVEHLVSHDGLPPLTATWRLDDPEVSDHHAAWWLRVRRAPAVAMVELGPLSREESAEQLRLLAGADVADEVVDRIYLKSRGQPLFTEQLAAQPISDEGLPGLLSDLLDRRLQDLDDPSWAVVSTLGIADRALSDDLLPRATGLTEDVLEATMRGLSGRRLLASDANQAQLALRHPLLAEAARRRLSSREARRAHRRLAEAMAVTSAAQAAEVAEHWRGATDASHELEWRIRAARESAQRFAKRQEAAHWLRALEIWAADRDTAGDPPVSRTRARFAAMHALEQSAQGEAAWLLADQMMGEPPPDPADQAEMYMQAARYRAHSDRTAGLELLDRALLLYKRLGPSANHVRALRYREGMLFDLGRREEAEAALIQALEINQSVGDWRHARRMLATVARHHVASGQYQQALVDLAEATRATTEPDPAGDAFIAMMHTDVLLELSAPVEAVAAAAEPALQASARHGIDAQAVATTRANLAEALLRAGRVTDAAAHVDQWTDQRPRAADWALHLLRLDIDVRRGMLPEVLARAAALREGILAPQALSDQSLQVEAEALIWAEKPRGALKLLEPLLERIADSEEVQLVGSLLLLTARAAADVGPTGNSRASIQADTLEHIRSTARDDPFGARAGPLAPAGALTYSAELGRLGGDQRVDAWLTAATEWDRLSRPHEAAYCRWRAAEIALREGQATTAARLLKRAATDAREHVPLLAAIRHAPEGQAAQA